MASTLEELEARVADLEQYVEEQAIHTLSWSAEQIDAFFALLESRVFTSGRKTIEITDNSTVYGTAFLSAAELGATNITDDIRVIFTVHKQSSVSQNPYYDRYATGVFKDTSNNLLCLKFAESGLNLATNSQAKLSRGTYYLDWLRIG